MRSRIGFPEADRKRREKEREREREMPEWGVPTFFGKGTQRGNPFSQFVPHIWEASADPKPPSPDRKLRYYSRVDDDVRAGKKRQYFFGRS